MSSQQETPLMQQWRAAKKRHPDALIFFRVGDFYEMFNEDAREGARLLGLTLTSRNNGGAAEVPLAGVPVRAKDEYLERLVRLGRRVAICEQVENPAEARGIVRREVVETITPGVVLSDALLQGRRNNFLVALARDGGTGIGLAAVDISTGDVVATPVEPARLEAEVARFEAAELLLPETWEGDVAGAESASVTRRPAWAFDAEMAAEEIRRRYRVTTLDGFGFQHDDGALIAALGALLAYLGEVRPMGSEPLKPPRIERPGSAMALDEMTRRNLELVEPLRPDLARATGRAGTLLEVVDQTMTAMGGRLLRRWLLRPLVEPEPIWARQHAVGELVDDPPLRRRLRAELRDVIDLERLAGRIGAAQVTPRELGALRKSLERLPELAAAVAAAARGGGGGTAVAPPEAEAVGSPGAAIGREGAETPHERNEEEAPRLEPGRGAGSPPPERPEPLLRSLALGIDPLDDVLALLAEALADEPPAVLADGGVIRAGWDAELDDLRELRDGARDFIARLQARERELTGIGSLKVGFNKVFGYYLEVTRANVDKVPERYERRQTLANAERYVTPELKEWESKVLDAEERIVGLEARIFGELRRRVAEEVARLQDTAERVGALDVLAGLAELAVKRGYVRPEVHTGFALEIVAGRHPVVETMMPREDFIANDLVLDEDRRILILTGPNMAGKSTLLRQVGLIQLLAQIGAFVPADSARLPVCDRIFTRVGASDNLVRGQSTFLVEMQETAAILHGASERSLVLLDEIGRGTATYDGVSIAWAVTEHLRTELGAKTIFATHYHELTQLSELLPGVANGNVAVREAGDDIIFLHRLEPGGADRSYGIQVGRLAGLPPAVVERAKEVLRTLEGAHAAGGERLGRPVLGGGGKKQTLPLDQLSLFHAPEPPVLGRLREIEIENLTPLQAMNLLAELRAEARAGEKESR